MKRTENGILYDTTMANLCGVDCKKKDRLYQNIETEDYFLLHFDEDGRAEIIPFPPNKARNWVGKKIPIRNPYEGWKRLVWTEGGCNISYKGELVASTYPREGARVHRQDMVGLCPWTDFNDGFRFNSIRDDDTPLPKLENLPDDTRQIVWETERRLKKIPSARAEYRYYFSGKKLKEIVIRWGTEERKPK